MNPPGVAKLDAILGKIDTLKDSLRKRFCTCLADTVNTVVDERFGPIVKEIRELMDVARNQIVNADGPIVIDGDSSGTEEEIDEEEDKVDSLPEKSKRKTRSGSKTVLKKEKASSSSSSKGKSNKRQKTAKAESDDDQDTSQEEAPEADNTDSSEKSSKAPAKPKTLRRRARIFLK